MLFPIAYQKTDVRLRMVGELLVESLNASFTTEITDDFLESMSIKIDAIAKKFETIEEFDKALAGAEEMLNFEPVSKDDEEEIPEHLVESFKTIAMNRVQAYHLMFVAHGYPVIFDQWSVDNNINELIETRYLFDCDDLRADYTNIYTAFIRLCARLRNRTPNPDVEGSENQYRDDFRNCKLLATRLRSFAMIADDEEQY